MKKNFFYGMLAAILFCGMSVVTSCSNEEINDLQKTTVENAKVIADLKNVNAELLATAPSETRGWGSWTNKQRMRVVSADLGGAVTGGKAGAWTGAKVGTALGNPITGGVFGAALGAIVGGAYSSWLATPDEVRQFSNEIEDSDKTQGQTGIILGRNRTLDDDFTLISQSCRFLLKDDLSINEELIDFVLSPTSNKVKSTSSKLKQTNNNNNLDLDQELLTQSKLDENSLTIGKMHNTMLSVLDGSVELLPNTDMASESELKKALFESEELMDACRNIKSDADNLTSDVMLNKVIELFNHVLLEYPSKADDVAFIIGKYIDVIEESTELTEDQKTHIKYGLSTALYSSVYWEKVFQNK